MINFLLTILVGLLLGYIFMKFKVPGGMMVGSIIGVTILNTTTQLAYMPSLAKTAAQIIAGAFIGIGIEKSDLHRLKHIFKPAFILVFGMLILNIISGLLIYVFSPLDLMTSLMGAVPGGISDVPIISGEMGADPSKVAMLQFARLLVGIGFFPTMINKISKSKFIKENETNSEIYTRTSTNNDTIGDLIITLLIAIIFGLIGKVSKVPSATLVLSMISVIVFKLTTNRGSMPRWMRRLAQVLSGAYIGSGIEMSHIMEMKYLIIPIFILITGYLIACFIIGWLMHKRCSMPIAETMLAATPAGASDMALISADMGIKSADVIVLQIIRMVVVISMFPQIIHFISKLII